MEFDSKNLTIGQHCHFDKTVEIEKLLSYCTWSHEFDTWTKNYAHFCISFLILYFQLIYDFLF